MTSRMLEGSALALFILAMMLSAAACVIMLKNGQTSEETSAAAAVDAVARIRAQGEAREFDARVGALRIVWTAENPSLSRALEGIESIRRIEDQTGRTSETDAAMAIGFEQARASVARGEAVALRADTALVCGAGAGALASGVLAAVALYRRRRDRRRIAAGIGLDPASGDRESFADEVLLEWIRKSVHRTGVASGGDDVHGERARLTIVEATPPATPPPDDRLASSFGPTRRR